MVATAQKPHEVSKTSVIQDIEALKRQWVECVDKAEEMRALTEGDDGRPLTEPETTEFNGLLEEADRLEVLIQDAQDAADKAAVRAAVDDRRRRVDTAPSPRTRLNAGPLSRVSYMHDRILDDPRRGFSGWGDFAMSIVDAFTPGRGVQDERLLKIAAASGMQQSQGSQGGYLVPPSFSQQIWDGLNQAPENIMAMCDQYPVTGESLTIPANAETSRANGSRYGGIQGYWLAEAQEKVGSAPRFRQMKLEPQELAVLVFATDRLLRNAPALEAYIRRAATEEINFMVGHAIFFGSGAGQPLGVMQSGALVTVAAEAGQAADSIVAANINKMYARLHTRARTGAVWFINQDVEPELDNLTVPAATSGWPALLPAPSGAPTLAEAPLRRLKGLPVYTVEYCSSIGDLGDIILANLGWYALGTQGGIDEAMSIHVRFQFDESCFRFVFYVDGQGWLHQPLTPFKGNATLSSFVTLAAR
jgi:HK97 family phage major capsid protein